MNGADAPIQTMGLGEIVAPGTCGEAGAEARPRSEPSGPLFSDHEGRDAQRSDSSAFRGQNRRRSGNILSGDQGTLRTGVDIHRGKLETDSQDAP